MADNCFSKLQEILEGTLTVIRDSNLWGWNARPNGAFLVIDSKDADATISHLTTRFSHQWDHITVAEASAETIEIVEYLMGLRERQVLYTLPCADNLICYAAYWPWNKGDRVAVRVSMFHTGNTSLSSAETESLIQAVLNANKTSEHSDQE